MVTSINSPTGIDARHENKAVDFRRMTASAANRDRLNRAVLVLDLAGAFDQYL